MIKWFCLFIFPVFLFSQEPKIGEWKEYLSYSNPSFIADGNEKIYCVSSGGLFYIDLKYNSIHRLSKVNGLSDINIKKIAYNNEFNALIIVYENCNLDLIINNTIINIPDVKRKEITGLKSVNNVYTKQDLIYLSCSFGLVVIDLIKEEIKDTYVIGDESQSYEVTGCTILGDTIFASTSFGVFYGEKNSQFLNNYNNWTKLNRFNDSLNYINILSSESKVYTNKNNLVVDISLKNNLFVETYKDSIVYFQNSQKNKILNPYFTSLKFSTFDNRGVLWVADSINGLLAFDENVLQNTYIPSGPKENDLYSLKYINSKLYMCHGGHVNFGVINNNQNGLSIKNDFDQWSSLNYFDLNSSRDIINIAKLENKTYLASWYDGIVVLKDSEFSSNDSMLIFEEYETKYNYSNTNGVLDTTYYSNNRIQISDLKFDNQANLWGINNQVEKPLFVKTANDEWFSFSMNQDIVGLYFDDLIITRDNKKWGIIARGNGIFVYDDKGTLDNSLDDEYKLLNKQSGNGALNSMEVEVITEDLNGDIWVGTKEGVCVFYSPELVFTNYNFDAQQILIQQGEYGQYLLSSEQINSILVDGANRKWIGTAGAGLFLMSEDGTEEIHHFTAQNSPLFSNNIIALEINNKTGEVYIGTDRGLLSYKSDATEGMGSQENIFIYPNPVRPSYKGLVAIRGLYTGSRVKITDINGNLIYEDTAKGGQVTWDGKDQNNSRVNTGVYLVFCTSELGKYKVVDKILFVK